MRLTKNIPRTITVCNRINLLNELKLLPKSCNISEILEFIRSYKQEFVKNIKLSKFEQGIDEFKIPSDSNSLIRDWLENFINFASQVACLRFTSFQGKAFQIIRTITKYDQFLKRDGSIITVIKDSNGTIVTNPSNVQENLIQYLRSRDENLTKDHPPEPLISFPFLPPISDQELIDLVENISSHKALSPFPVPDELLKCIKSRDSFEQLLECWDPSFLNSFPEIFESKLPLNKIHPLVPTVKQMRPIVVTNVIFKLVESRFLSKLQRCFWSLPGFAKSQY